jgi:hypothetical protein
MNDLVAFAFIVAVPLVVVAGGLVSLYAVGALFAALDSPGEIAGSIEAFFRGKQAPSKPAPEDHYYRAYWAEKPRG